MMSCDWPATKRPKAIEVGAEPNTYHVAESRNFREPSKLPTRDKTIIMIIIFL